MSLTVHWIGLFQWNVLMPVVGYNQLNELKFTEIRFNTHIHKLSHTRLQKKQKYLRTHIYRGISDLCVCASVFYLRPQFPLNSYINVIFSYCLWTIIHLFEFFVAPIGGVAEEGFMPRKTRKRRTIPGRVAEYCCRVHLLLTVTLYSTD